MARPYNGSLTGSPSFVTGKSGWGGEAVQLNGSSQCVDLSANPPPALNLPGGGWAVTLWLDCTALPANQRPISVQDSTSTHGWYLNIGTDGHMGLYIGSTFVGSTSSSMVGGYHFVEVGFDGAVVYYFLDGTKLFGTSGLTLTAASSPGVVLGAGKTSPGGAFSAWFTGILQECAVYNLVLHTANYSVPTIPTSPGAAHLQALYSFQLTANDTCSPVLGSGAAGMGLLLAAAGVAVPSSRTGTASAALGLLLSAAGSGMAAVPVPFAPRARTSYPEPVVDPGSAPGDTPLVYVPVNVLWLPFIAGALTQLQQRSAWKALNQQQLQDLIGRVNDLIAAFGAGEQ